MRLIWAKVFNNGPSKICGGHSLKNLEGYGLLKQFVPVKTLSWSKRYSLTVSAIYYFIVDINNVVSLSLKSVSKDDSLKWSDFKWGWRVNVLMTS